MLSELINNFDKKFFYFVNSSLKNKVFDTMMPLITRLGEDLVIILIGISFFILGKKKGKITSVLIITALFLARLSVLVLKRITHRPRPFLVYENAHLIGTAFFSSFPSGHTTLATAVCIILCFKYKRFSLIFIILALLVGISRLYVGQHYPTDILAGFVLGSIVAYVVLYLEKFLQKNKFKSAV